MYIGFIYGMCIHLSFVGSKQYWDTMQHFHFQELDMVSQNRFRDYGTCAVDIWLL